MSSQSQSPDVTAAECGAKQLSLAYMCIYMYQQCLISCMRYPTTPNSESRVCEPALHSHPSHNLQEPPSISTESSVEEYFANCMYVHVCKKFASKVFHDYTNIHVCTFISCKIFDDKTQLLYTLVSTQIQTSLLTSTQASTHIYRHIVLSASCVTKMQTFWQYRRLPFVSQL